MRKQYINLAGPTVLRTSSRATPGRSATVTCKGVSIEPEGYIPDLYVTFSSDVDDLCLYEDETFIADVMRLLRTLGYAGPAFGRAETGMQSPRAIALEPGREFRAWVTERYGWRDLDETPNPRSDPAA